MTDGVPAVAARVSMGIMAGAMLLVFGRLLRGPTLADRVVALDLLAVLAAGIAAAHSVSAGEPLYLRAAIVLSLVSFLGTVAFAFYIERRETP